MFKQVSKRKFIILSVKGNGRAWLANPKDYYTAQPKTLFFANAFI